MANAVEVQRKATSTQSQLPRGEGKSGTEKSRAKPIGMSSPPASIHGRLRPQALRVRSERAPTVGSTSMSQSFTIASVAPARAGAMPSVSVMK